MLTNLLPGLRELRPPLAAGALWLVTAFVTGRALADGGVGLGAFEEVVDSFSALATTVDDVWGPGVMMASERFWSGGSHTHS